jgi:chaperone modulatory protein CbpM
MISMEVLITELNGLPVQDLERWISNRWVRPDGQAGTYLFREIDVARAHLIWELREQMQVNEDAIPVVLLLLDQLYDQRRHIKNACSQHERMAGDQIQ